MKDSLNRESAEKLITFSVSIEKGYEIDKKKKKKTYRIKFIDTERFMASSLSSLADNLAAGVDNSKCKRNESCINY